MLCIARYSSPLGPITLAGEGEALAGLWFDGQRYFAAGLPDGCPEGEAPAFAAARRWLDDYFAGRLPGPPPALAPLCATPFRRAVWRELAAIPRGQTVTYGQLAARLAAGGWGRAVPARAVGGAVGRNPISLIVPCHRVVGSDGSLTGYAGGLDRKRWLLGLEGAPSAPRKE